MKRVLAGWVVAALLSMLSPAYATTAAAPEVQSKNQPPVAMVTDDFVRGRVPLEVCFDASKSHDPEGKALTYGWDFGDGSRTATTAKVCHEYVQAGLYAASVTVTDDQGLTAHETVVVLVQETPRETAGK